MTYTYAILDVSAPTFDEIAEKLRAAAYHHCFDRDVIDMHGIALQKESTAMGKRGFGSMSPAKQREVSRKGGKAAHRKGTANKWNTRTAREAGRKGGRSKKRSRTSTTRTKLPTIEQGWRDPHGEEVSELMAPSLPTEGESD